MSLVEDINESISNIKLAEPIYVQLNNRGENLRYELEGDHIKEGSLDDIVWKFSNVKFNESTGQFKLDPSEHIIENTENFIREQILVWIKNCTWSPNPKLTPTYRWYYSRENITESMYILWKYMSHHCPNGFYDSYRSHSTNDPHYHNILCLIEWIRLRGE